MTQTVKMNELFSPAALASQVLFQLAKILLFYSSIHELDTFPSNAVLPCSILLGYNVLS